MRSAGEHLAKAAMCPERRSSLSCSVSPIDSCFYETLFFTVICTAGFPYALAFDLLTTRGILVLRFFRTQRYE
ncbi:hypothetical protein OIDMADRAFT_16882 [Oidiodendron maius Zn]|uniref:Uncharacterized protein n=1 Tax=Oidiodendron maius (strain Zn) TaxID=913774 RepID=A0A0C3DU04_OIDMZ|nr:hypothetical protein OIDMADRAFT_16882 [Oidiodendron maius Zn]